MVTFENVVRIIYKVLKQKYPIPENKEVYLLKSTIEDFEMHRLFYGLSQVSKSEHKGERCVDILIDPEDDEGYVINLGFGPDVMSSSDEQMVFIGYGSDDEGNINVKTVIDDIHQFLYSGFYPTTDELLH